MKSEVEILIIIALLLKRRTIYKNKPFLLSTQYFLALSINAYIAYIWIASGSFGQSAHFLCSTNH